MKWFQHQSNAYTDIALKEIVAEFGMEGYGFYWLCCELVAQQGKKYKISPEKSWKSHLKLNSNLNQEKIDKILDRFANLNLINKKSLKIGALSMPKMKNYSDNFSKYQQSNFKVTSKSIQSNFVKNRIDKNRIDKNILNNIVKHFFELKGWDNQSKDFYKKNKIVYGKYTRPAKELYELCDKNEDLVKKKLNAIKAWADEKGLEWTLNTAIKRWNEQSDTEGEKEKSFWDMITKKNKQKYGF